MTILRIQDLEPGAEILCYMRLGFALKTGVTGKGDPYRYVPQKPCRAHSGDLTQFSAWVVLNQPLKETISLQVTRTDSYRGAFNRDIIPLVAEVPYASLQRVQKFSEIHYEAKEESLFRPTRKALGTAFRAYRTLTNVRLV